jgi:hypothetical protein
MTFLPGSDIESFVLLLGAASVSAAGVEFLRALGPPGPEGETPPPTARRWEELGLGRAEVALLGAAAVLIAGVALVVLLRAPSSLRLLAAGVVLGGLVGLGLGAFGRVAAAVAERRIAENADPLPGARRYAPRLAAARATTFALSGSLLVTLMGGYLVFAGDLLPVAGIAVGMAAAASVVPRSPGSGPGRGAAFPLDLLACFALATTSAMLIGLTDPIVRELFASALLFPLCLLALTPILTVAAAALGARAPRDTDSPVAGSSAPMIGAAILAVVGAGLLGYLVLGWSSSVFLATTLGVVAAAAVASLPALLPGDSAAAGSTGGGRARFRRDATLLGLSVGIPAIALSAAYAVGGWPAGPGVGEFNVSLGLYGTALAAIGFLLLAVAAPSAFRAPPVPAPSPGPLPAGPAAYRLGATLVAMVAVLSVGPGLVARIRATDVDTAPLLTVSQLWAAALGFGVGAITLLILRQALVPDVVAESSPHSVRWVDRPTLRRLAIGGLVCGAAAGPILVAVPGAFIGVLSGSLVGMVLVAALPPSSALEPEEQTGERVIAGAFDRVSEEVQATARWMSAVALLAQLSLTALTVLAITYWKP